MWTLPCLEPLSKGFLVQTEIRTTINPLNECLKLQIYTENK